MSSAKSAVSTRAASVAQRSTKIEFKEVDVPASADSFVSSFKNATGIKTGIANQFIINVLPNFTPILLFVIYHVLQNIKFLEPKEHAKISAPTFVMYCMTIIYAHFLVSDAFVAPHPSRHAEEIKNDTTYSEYLEFLLGLPVPDFLTPVIKYFTTTTTGRRGNIWFVPRAAGFNHFMHFGRFFPVNMFASMHDIAATTNSRTNPDDVRLDLNDSVIFTLSAFLSDGTPKEYVFSNFFASLIDQTRTGALPQNQFLANKVNQVITSLFNPVLLRAMQQKQTFTELALLPPTFATPNYNPYILMLAMTKRNIFELRTVFSSFVDAINGTIKCTTDLAGMYKDYSGVSILVHGYSRFALPTWNAGHSDRRNNPTDAQKKFRPMADDTYASAIQFKFHEYAFAGFTNVDLPTVTAHAGPSGDAPPADQTFTLTFPHPLAWLRTSTNGQPNQNTVVPSRREIASYKTDTDLYPKVKILNFNEEDSASAYLTTLCGMIIEADELAGSTVQHPHPDAAVEEDNAQFLNSAISFRHVRRATQFRTHDPVISVVIPPPRPTYTEPPAASFIRSLTKVFLPYLNDEYAHSGYSRLHYGLTHINDVSYPEATQTFLGFKLRNRATGRRVATEHEPASTAYDNLLLWSPYTYVSPALDEEWDHTNADTALMDMYFLSNLRTIFGTDVTLMEVNHPLAAMPVA